MIIYYLLSTSSVLTLYKTQLLGLQKEKKHCGQNNLSSKKFTNVFSGSSQALPILRTYQGANVNHLKKADMELISLTCKA